jgi:hypothetical protein
VFVLSVVGLKAKNPRLTWQSRVFEKFLFLEIHSHDAKAAGDALPNGHIMSIGGSQLNLFGECGFHS